MQCANTRWNLSLTAGGAEAAGTARGVGEVAFFDLNGLIACDDHLGNPVAFGDLIGLAAEVYENYFHFAAVARVNSAGAVRNADGVFEGEAGARADLRFESRGQFDGQTGGDSLRDVRLQESVSDRTEVHAGVFFRAVSILGDHGVRVQFTNAKYHCEVEIPVCLIA